MKELTRDEKELINDEREQFRKKTLSVRFTGDYLDYFLKFAQENNCQNISDVFHKMVDKVAEQEPLDDVEFMGNLFNETAKKEQMSRIFLANQNKEKQKVSLGSISLPEIDPHAVTEDVEDEQEDEFII